MTTMGRGEPCVRGGDFQMKDGYPPFFLYLGGASRPGLNRGNRGRLTVLSVLPYH